jgi:hypothetical protein
MPPHCTYCAIAIMSSPAVPFPTADAPVRNLKPGISEQSSTQPYDADPSSIVSFSPPTVSQGQTESLLGFFPKTHPEPTRPLPSPPLATATPAPPFPTRSDSLRHSRRANSEDDTKSFPSRAHSMASSSLPSTQSAHPPIAFRSISVSDRSSNGDTFSSLASTPYLSSTSSKSSFVWDAATKSQSFSGKRNIQELAPVNEKKLVPSTHADPAAQEVGQADMPTPPGIDVQPQDYGDDSFEEEASPADKIIYEIMSHIKRIPDFVAAAQVNTGFYGVFCDRGVELIRKIILDTSPAAWEYMETAYVTPGHPSSFLRSYRQSLSCLSAIKKALFLRSESVLKPDTMDGLMGVSYEKEQKVEAALWRIWTFCELFGCESGREKDSQSQMAWLHDGAEARTADRPSSFGAGNGKGLSVPELLLMAELWNALSTLLQQSFRLSSEDDRYSLFTKTDAQYPEELYLLEWVSYVMTFGLAPIAILASGSLEEAQNLGFTNWSPPREFGTRQAFLKHAVASTYRRRLQEEAEANAAAAGLSMRATYRALATTKRRPIVRPAPSENSRNQHGVVPRKAIGSGALTTADQALPAQIPQIQPPPITDDNAARPRQSDISQSPHDRGGLPEPYQGPSYLRPEDGMVSFLEPETRPGSAVNNTISSYNLQPAPSLSGGSSGRSYQTQSPSSPSLGLSERQQLSPSSHKHAVVDPVDKALALLVDEMGFSLAASKKALAASDDGSGLNTDKAIALLQERVSASSTGKIPVVDANRPTKPAPRFGGMKFKFGSKAAQQTRTEVSPLRQGVKSPPQPTSSQKAFGELKPTKKERTAYANLSPEEAKGIKTDVFRAKVYKEAFGDLFQGGREEKVRRDSASTVSAVEVEGRSLSPVGSWNLRGLDGGSISSKRIEAASSDDVRSVKS